MKLTKAKKNYEIRSYECDKYGNLRLLTLMNIFQDIADSNATEIGVGFDFCKENGLAWIGANYHIIINKFPRLHQKITVLSWPSAEKKLGAYRDFLIEDESGNVMVKASSQWILINFAKRRPVSLREHLPEYFAISERAVETEFPKIEFSENINRTQEFKIRFDDIDFNGHVNNAVYPLWATEAAGDGFREKNEPQEIEIAFKKEAFLGENIVVESSVKPPLSSHIIKSATDNRELARVKISWRPLAQL